MRFALSTLAAFFVLSSFGFSQDDSRDRAYQQIRDLNQQLKSLEESFLQPSALDLKQAQSVGLNAFRLLPREKYDRKLTIRGGGSYYSFSTRSNDYDHIPQIGLERNELRLGFAGFDFGLIADLDETLLSDISRETAEVTFLLSYLPETTEKDARRRGQTIGINSRGMHFRQNVPAIVGHSYAVRAVNYGQADVLVAFRIVRKDTDGSLVIFWKPIEFFAVPVFETSAEPAN